jgi:hypothetical protein
MNKTFKVLCAAVAVMFASELVPLLARNWGEPPGFFKFSILVNVALIAFLLVFSWWTARGSLVGALLALGALFQTVIYQLLLTSPRNPQFGYAMTNIYSMVSFFSGAALYAYTVLNVFIRTGVRTGWR